MKRNDACIKKTINHQLKASAEMSNSIFMSFKRLYFDMKINLKNKRLSEFGINNVDISFNALNRPSLQKLIDLNVIRYKKIPVDEEGDNSPLNPKTKEDYPIEVDSELKSFLKSCGNRLNQNEIEFMVHLIENFDAFESGKITCRQLYDIWGALIHFSTKKPEEIIEFVFEKYFEERNDIESVRRDIKELNLGKIEEFLRWYNEYFTDGQMHYMKNECQYMNKEFSLDAFNYMLLTPRKYHPY